MMRRLAILVFKTLDGVMQEPKLMERILEAASSKEAVNQKDLEILFILHEDKLYRLTMFEPKS